MHGAASNREGDLLGCRDGLQIRQSPETLFGAILPYLGMKSPPEMACNFSRRFTIWFIREIWGLMDVVKVFRARWLQNGPPGGPYPLFPAEKRVQKRKMSHFPSVFAREIPCNFSRRFTIWFVREIWGLMDVVKVFRARWLQNGPPGGPYPLIPAEKRVQKRKMAHFQITVCPGYRL